jgi:hypothetical protein
MSVIVNHDKRLGRHIRNQPPLTPANCIGWGCKSTCNLVPTQKINEFPTTRMIFRRRDRRESPTTHNANTDH